MQKISVISMVLQARYSVVTFFPVRFLLVVGADIYVVLWQVCIFFRIGSGSLQGMVLYHYKGIGFTIYLHLVHKHSLVSDHSVHRGINPPQTPPPPLSCQAPPLKSTNCPRPLPFKAIPFSTSVFYEVPPPKSQIFHWRPEILKFFIP